jgi:succinate dehydrogenase hydrophobic anchor subunit
MRHTRLWIASMLSAALMVVLLGLHMAEMHLSGLLSAWRPDWVRPLEWERVVERGRDGATVLGYLLLLAAGLYHGFHGLYTSLTELVPRPAAERWLAGGCIVAALAFFVIGTAATLAFGLG